MKELTVFDGDNLNKNSVWKELYPAEHSELIAKKAELDAYLLETKPAMVASKQFRDRINSYVKELNDLADVVSAPVKRPKTWRELVKNHVSSSPTEFTVDVIRIIQNDALELAKYGVIKEVPDNSFKGLYVDTPGGQRVQLKDILSIGTIYNIGDCTITNYV